MENNTVVAELRCFSSYYCIYEGGAQETLIGEYQVRQSSMTIECYHSSISFVFSSTGIMGQISNGR